LQDVQNRRGAHEFCVVLNDRNIVMGIIEGDAWNGNPLARAADVMNPAPRTFRPDADPKEIVKELRKDSIENALVTSSDGELLGVLKVGQKKTQPDKAA
jgi:Mg/Co/Ni transporter MgtE